MIKQREFIKLKSEVAPFLAQNDGSIFHDLVLIFLKEMLPTVNSLYLCVITTRRLVVVGSCSLHSLLHRNSPTYSIRWGGFVVNPLCNGNMSSTTHILTHKISFLEM